ncbi:HAD-IA family hydrolase [Acidipropionibacterium timonense]|uniref:HAD-IA family hydrolase n=1 Tax=Acidipropionibacterium timonense TaxID=2161818 RepID=UPI00102F4948|nr:HAD-IA family hydrolase [Acidipropionibacterium timonense]
MRTIIWDMGGTLVDTYPQVDEALADAVRRACGVHPGRAAVSQLTQVSIAHAIDVLAARHGVERRLLEQAYADLKDRWRTHPAPLMAGARQVMDAVHAAGGLNLVATHRDRTSAEQLFEALGITVDDLVCAPDGIARKPDPAMNLLLLARHHLDPARVLCVGDREIDVDAARAAGCASALLDPTGHASTSADHHVRSLTELLPLVP